MQKMWITHFPEVALRFSTCGLRCSRSFGLRPPSNPCGLPFFLPKFRVDCTRWCAAVSRGQSLVKSAVSPSVEDLSPLPRCRLDLTATLPHDTSADRKRRGAEHASLGVGACRRARARQARGSFCEGAAVAADIPPDGGFFIWQSRVAGVAPFVALNARQARGSRYRGRYSA